jgi:hypothetical protein
MGIPDGTRQNVAPGDPRWTLGLVGARVIASAASRLRELLLTPRFVFGR